MIWLLIYLFAVIVALGMGLLAGYSDFRGMKIPNMLPLYVVGAFVPAYAAVYFSGHFGVDHLFAPLLRHIACAIVILIVTFCLFTIRFLGGGDAKLLSAYALWTSFYGLPPLLFYMAVSGAFVGLATIYLNKKKPFAQPREGSWIARAQAGENRVPYGIPIVIGAFVAFLLQGYLSPHKLVLFLAGQ